MSKPPVEIRNPVTRVVKDGGVWHADKHYVHDALLSYEGKEVLVDPVIDVDKNCFSGFEVWSADGQKLCAMELHDE